MRQAYDYWQNQPGNYPEPTPERRDTPPKGGGCERYREGRAATDRTPSRGHQTLQRSPDAARPIRLPPLSSPEGRPRREVSGTRPPTFAACAPQEEEARGGSSLFRGRYLPGLTPERLLKDDSKANNPQTRKGACRRKTTGLQIPSPRPGAAGTGAGCLLLWALTHLTKRLRVHQNLRWLAD